jgi:hypothetical protein
MPKQYLKIMVNSGYNIERMKLAIAKYEPKILTLEGECPSVNNRVIRYAQYLEKCEKKANDLFIPAVRLYLFYDDCPGNWYGIKQ